MEVGKKKPDEREREEERVQYCYHWVRQPITPSWVAEPDLSRRMARLFLSIFYSEDEKRKRFLFRFPVANARVTLSIRRFLRRSSWEPLVYCKQGADRMSPSGLLLLPSTFLIAGYTKHWPFVVFPKGNEIPSGHQDV